MAETIVSKVQGGKTRVWGGKAPLGSPSDPPMSGCNSGKDGTLYCMIVFKDIHIVCLQVEVF